MFDPRSNTPDSIIYPPRTQETHSVDELEMQKIKAAHSQISTSQSFFWASVSLFTGRISTYAISDSFIYTISDPFIVIAVVGASISAFQWIKGRKDRDKVFNDIYSRKIEPESIED